MKMLRYYLGVTLFVITLTGCMPSSDTTLSEENAWFIILDIDPPKHFYISLREEITGILHHKLYVSKRCSSWKKWEVGNRVRLVKVTRENESGTYTRIEGLRKALCQ